MIGDRFPARPARPFPVAARRSDERFATIRTIRGTFCRRYQRRTGTLLSLLIVAAFVASARWQFVVHSPTPRGTALYLEAGGVLVVTELLFVPMSVEAHNWGLTNWNSWSFTRIARDPSLIAIYARLPLWPPFAAVLLPTLLAWRFWPKPVKPGHCRCGYDLTGNESGTCPECGRSSQSAA